MTDKIIDFESARSPHDLARKDQKLSALRKRFKAASGLDTKPKKKRGGKKSKKNKKR